jgi:acyl-homoserine lactone acylase PvdQ
MMRIALVAAALLVSGLSAVPAPAAPETAWASVVRDADGIRHVHAKTTQPTYDRYSVRR